MRVGIREFKQKTSYILRQVRENKEEFIITYRGKPVARLIPVKKEDEKTFAEVWAELDRLAEKVSKQWQPGISAVEAVKEGRREL